MTPVAKREGSLATNLALLLGSVAFALLLLGALEGGLRLLGLGAPDPARSSRLRYQHVELPIFAPGTRRDGTPVLRSADPRLPHQSILERKAQDSLRVFVFGESAVAGLGFSPNVTFVRELERMLRRAAPAKTLEVVNLGIVALASAQVRLLVAEVCRRYEPDAVVIYTGNNEFLEIHAAKYATARGSALARVRDALLETHLYRVVGRALGSRPRPLSGAGLADEERRVTENVLIQEVELSSEEIAGIVDAYEENVEAMTRAAARAGVPAFLMTVASNWRWRGREDLPPDWLDALVGPTQSGEARPRLGRALELLNERVAAAPARERAEWLYRRATVHEALGDLAAARDDFRSAMNEDRHFRRTLDAENARVRAVAARSGATLVDVVALLEGEAEHGIIGFGEFYDYVHFTPRGSVLVAGELFRALQRAGLVPAAQGFDPEAHLRERLRRLAELREDPLAVEDFMGFGDDPARIADRDLWKYERTLRELDARLAADPRDFRALVWRGDASWFRIDGAAEAERDWRAALEIDPGSAPVRANLERLLAEGRD